MSLLCYNLFSRQFFESDYFSLLRSKKKHVRAFSPSSGLVFLFNDKLKGGIYTYSPQELQELSHSEKTRVSRLDTSDFRREYNYSYIKKSSAQAAAKLAQFNPDLIYSLSAKLVLDSEQRLSR
jgi:hypothetical protein